MRPQKFEGKPNVFKKSDSYGNQWDLNPQKVTLNKLQHSIDLERSKISNLVLKNQKDKHIKS